MCRCLWRPGEGAGIAGDFELSNMGIKVGSSGRAVRALNCWTSSPSRFVIETRSYYRAEACLEGSCSPSCPQTHIFLHQSHKRQAYRRDSTPDWLLLLWVSLGNSLLLLWCSGCQHCRLSQRLWFPLLMYHLLLGLKCMLLSFIVFPLLCSVLFKKLLVR